jgi:hypothetical protein
MDPARPARSSIDATKPAGEWNHVRMVLSPQKCEHYMNGVKYLEYVLHSDDFNAKVAASKFGQDEGLRRSPTLGLSVCKGTIRARSRSATSKSKSLSSNESV